MPEKETLERAAKDKRQGKAPSTQAGEFIREEFHHVREGKHGVRNTKQAIAIGLSKARRAGVKLPTEQSGRARRGTRPDWQTDVAPAGTGSPRCVEAGRPVGRIPARSITASALGGSASQRDAALAGCEARRGDASAHSVAVNSTPLACPYDRSARSSVSIWEFGTARAP